MRIVFLTHNFPRFPGDLSGLFLATLARALVERGHHLTVIAPADQGAPGDPVLDGIRVRRVRYTHPAGEVLAYRGTMEAAVRSPWGAWRLLHLLRALRRAAREEMAGGADVIHAHWWIPAGLASPPDACMVLTAHGTDVRLLSRGAVGRIPGRRVLRRAKVVTVVSRAAAAEVERTTGIVVPTDHVQPMPVEPVHLSGWTAGGGGLVAIARLTPQKRLDLAIRAVGVLRDHGQPATLTIAGAGPERESLERLAANLDLRSEVRFVGPVSAAQASALLRTADLALAPSRDEGFGLAAAEALMAGVPVVACRDGGGLLDIVPPVGGGRVTEPTPAALAAAITELRSNGEASRDARRLGERWRALLAPERVAEVCEGWYREALGAR